MSIAVLLRKFFDPAEQDPSDRELADLGLSRTDYRQLVDGAPGTRERMEALAAKFGVTPEMIDRDRGLALQITETCGQCHVSGKCQRALDGKGVFDPEDCPNAARYCKLACG